MPYRARCVRRGVTMGQVNLEGTIDLHVHTAPDVWPRRLDDLALAREAAAAGMRALLLKSHHTLTADRATIVDGLVEDIRVFGGLALNDFVGGLNPAAVEAALMLGAREIWMPTISAANHRRAHGIPEGGISILDESGRLRPVLFEILKLIAQHDAILGTGHLSIQEIQHLVPAAQAAGVRRILITHPELSITNMSIAVQQALAGPGVFFERCLIVTVPPGPLVPPGPTVPLSAIAAAVQQVGPETTVLATDFGQPENPSPVEGLQRYIAGMMELGISQKDIERVTQINPARLLGL
jgi:hypothetical protein